MGLQEKVMRTKYLLFALVLILVATPIYAGTVYYVNGVSGNDSNPGTQLAPWKTIQKAANIMIASDETLVAAGNYPERVTITKSGNSAAMISFAATGIVECHGFTVKADYIRIAGFKVTATEASWNAPAYGIWIEGRYCTIENNYAYYSPRGGICLSPTSSSCIVRNNRCHRNGMEGMEIHGTMNLVENNEIWGSVAYHTPTGLNNGDADGIRFFGSGHIFRGNYIHDITYDNPENIGYDPHIDGFITWADSYHAAASNILIEKNLIILPVYKTPAANGHGFMFGEASYVTIRNNIVLTHGGTNTGARGGTCHHLNILNNTFIGRLYFLNSNYPVGISLQNCPNSTITNNIVYDQVDSAIYLSGTTLTGLRISNNCVYNSNRSIPGGTHQPYDLWNLDPSFNGPDTMDYHIRAGSPCIDAGMNATEIIDDFDGAPRPAQNTYDIGAYEFQGQAATSPSITAQPLSQTIQSGQTAVLSVTAAGTAPIAYQWYRGTSADVSNPISGATASSYTTPPLTQNTNYWARVSNAYGHKDSDNAVITVPLSISPPTVTTSAVTSISSTSASGGGSVTSAGGATVTARGVCWGLTANPTISGSRTANGSGTGSFTSSLTGLSSSTTYHVRAYATNASGTAYGSDRAFTTSQGLTLPAVTTSAATSISSTSASGGGNVISAGGSTVTARGVCWGLTANPTVSGSHTATGSGTGSFSSGLTGLSSSTTYHVRAYATNSSGTGYGADIPFTTTGVQGYTIPFSESFSGTSLPAGWTTRNEGSGIVDNWAISETPLAGGGPNEASCTWQDVTIGTSRLVSPPIDTTGYSTLYLNFKHVLSSFESGGVTIKVQTSPDGSTWTDESWSVTISASDAGPETVPIILTQNLNRTTTYVAFLISGNLHYFDKWYIDDLAITATRPGTLKPPTLAFPRSGTTNLPTIINLKWRDTNVGPQERGYRLRIRQEGGEYSYYSVGQDIKSFVLSGLSTNQSYFWNVMAVGDSVGTADSPWAYSGKDRQFRTGARTTLYSPVLAGATIAGPDQPTSMILQWQDTNSSPQEVRYDVRIKKAGGRYSRYSAGGGAVNYLIPNLQRNTTYIWNVRAKGDGRTTLNSAWGNSGSDMTFKTGQ